MTTPTIAAVLPAKGHTGGQTLIEITGAGFALAPPAPDVLPAPPQLSRVRVLFGGVEATDVEVVDDTTVYCTTPIHDPGPVDVVVQNLGETPASLLSSAGPFAATDGTDVVIKVNGAPSTATFVPGDIAVQAAATALEVAAVLNRLPGIQALVVAGKVVLRTDARGPDATLEPVNSDAVLLLGFEIGVHRGTTDLVPIDGESTSAPQAFEFLRPDLRKKGPVTLAVEQLLIELGRQVVKNVNFASHSDFDLETGDLLNTAMLAELPGIVLADMQLPDTTLPVGRIPQEVAGENGVTLVKEAEDLVDILVSAVVVTDDPIELVNLVSIMRRFARKNAELVVAVDPADPSKGTNEYPLEWEQGTAVNVTAQRGGDNLHTFTGQFSVRGVSTGDMPIAYAGAMPAGVQVGSDYESTSQLGWPRTAPADVGVGSQ
jgi:hypothetical protein